MRQFFRNYVFGSRRAVAPAPGEAAPLSPTAIELQRIPRPAEEHVIPYNSTTNTLLHSIDPSTLPDPSEICSICQEPLQDTHDEERVIVETTCGHHFCSLCINGYLTHQIVRPAQPGRTKCPNCAREWKIIWDPEGPSPPEREARVDDEEEEDEVWNVGPPPERGMLRGRRGAVGAIDAELPDMRRQVSVRRQRIEEANAAYILQAGFMSRGFP